MDGGRAGGGVLGHSSVKTDTFVLSILDLFSTLYNPICV